MLVADRKVVLGSLTLYISSPETYRAASLLVEFPKKKVAVGDSRAFSCGTVISDEP
jgi:hypothetical protein